MRIYLDNCSFNRPFDSQNSLKIKLEAQAKLYIQQLVMEKKLELVWSFILEYENDNNPFEERKVRISKWQDIAVFDCDENDEIVKKATFLMKKGLHQKDALHIASAIFSKVDYFISTDAKIINKKIDSIEILNPVDFVLRMEGTI
jgi:predicted nucleic acid-binding protein